MEIEIVQEPPCCPHCGEPIDLDPDSGSWECPRCHAGSGDDFLRDDE